MALVEIFFVSDRGNHIRFLSYIQQRNHSQKPDDILASLHHHTTYSTPTQSWIWHTLQKPTRTVEPKTISSTPLHGQQFKTSPGIIGSSAVLDQCSKKKGKPSCSGSAGYFHLNESLNVRRLQFHITAREQNPPCMDTPAYPVHGCEIIAAAVL